MQMGGLDLEREVMLGIMEIFLQRKHQNPQYLVFGMTLIRLMIYVMKHVQVVSIIAQIQTD